MSVSSSSSITSVEAGARVIGLSNNFSAVNNGSDFGADSDITVSSTIHQSPNGDGDNA